MWVIFRELAGVEEPITREKQTKEKNEAENKSRQPQQQQQISSWCDHMSPEKTLPVQ